MEKHTVLPENVRLFRDWLTKRGGIAVWQSVNLSNPAASWSTPALTEDGKPYPKPTWQADNTPARIITEANNVVVVTAREVKRFRVAVRLGRQGTMLKCSDAATRRIRTAVDRAGEGAWYEFDYTTQEAVILVSERETPLNEYREEA